MKLILFIFFFIQKTWLFGQPVELVVPRYHIDRISNVEFSPDGKFLLTTAGNSIILRETSTGNYLREFKSKNQVTAVKFLSDSRLFVAIAEGIDVFNIEKDQVALHIPGDFYSAVANKKRNEIIAFGRNENIGGNKTISLFAVSEKSYLRQKRIDEKFVSCSYSENGDKILLLNKSLKVYDIKTATISKKTFVNLPDSLIESVALRADNFTYALGLTDGSVRLYNAKNNTHDDLFTYKPFWIGSVGKGLVKDSVRLTVAVREIEFVDSKYLACRHRPFKVSDSKYVDPNELDMMWDNLQAELDESAGHKQKHKQEYWWNMRPTIVVWDLDGRKVNYLNTTDDPISICHDVIATPASIYHFSTKENVSIEGRNVEVRMAKFSSSSKKLLIEANYHERVMDIQQGTNVLLSSSYRLKSNLESFLHKDLVAIESDQNSTVLYDIENEKKTKEYFKLRFESKIIFNRVKQQMAFKRSDTMFVVNFENKVLFSMPYIRDRYSQSGTMSFSPDGELFTYNDERRNRTYRTNNYAVIDSIPRIGSEGEGNYFEKIVPGNKVIYYFSLNKSACFVRDFTHHRFIDSLKLEERNFYGEPVISSDGTMLATGHADGCILLFNFKGSPSSTKIQAHAAQISSLDFSSDGKYLLSTSTDGFIKFWDTQTLKEVVRLLLYQNDWVVVTPDGLFDGTPGGVAKLFFIHGLQTIELNQLKDRFYEPGLLSKVLGLSKEMLRKSQGLNEIKLFPKIDINYPDANSKELLAIHVSGQGGGIGQVKISINGKEATADARSVGTATTPDNLVIPFNLSGHPFLRNHELNLIEVRAYNSDGYLVSPPKKLYYYAEGEKQSTTKLFAVVIGTSDYNGTQLDLRFAAKDAEQFSLVLQEAGSRLFGKENTYVHLLTTNKKENWPTKGNIKIAFGKMSKQAKPNDILIVYLAGHGTNFGTEDSDFYYLTADAQNGNLGDPVVRNEVAISSHEFTELIKMVPALKQVMILDACHSGKFAEDLLAKREVKSAGEIRALERMKDRTGMYILSGSAADAVSYEASSYGQGLLTYSLLFGIKGGALRDKQYIDVMSLFQYCTDEVPRLAENIGGIQKPELRVPYGAESFDIGLVDEAVNKKIELPTPKPIFLRSIFQDEDTFGDPLELSEHLDALFKNGEGDSKVIFVDAMKFTDGYSLRGRYKKIKDFYQITFKLLNGDKLIKDWKTQGKDVDEISKKILEMSLQN